MALMSRGCLLYEAVTVKKEQTNEQVTERVIKETIIVLSLTIYVES